MHNIQDILIITIFITVVISIGLIGYLIGRIHSVSNIGTTQSFLKKNRSSIAQDMMLDVAIDEKKVVTNINTSDLEKKYSSLGDTTSSNENIAGSINKLKNLKG